MNDLVRCPWPGTDPLYVAYHDDEWGVPVRDDRELFMQAVGIVDDQLIDCFHHGAGQPSSPSEA